MVGRFMFKVEVIVDEEVQERLLLSSKWISNFIIWQLFKEMSA